MLNYDFTIFSNIYFVAAGLAILITIIISQRYIIPEVKYLALLEFSIAIWSIGNAFKIAAMSYHLKLLWSQISYLGISTTPVIFLLFALAYNKQKKYLTKKFHILFFSYSFLSLLITATNSWHNQFWTKLYIIKQTNGVFYEYGTFFLFYLILTYIIIFSGIVHLFLAIKKLQGKHKTQAILIIIAAIFSTLGNILYVLKLNPLPGLDLTPIFMMLSGLILFYTLYRFRIFILVPVARHNLVDSMSEGLLVIDSKDRIIDANPAIEKTISIQHNQLLGQNINQALNFWPELIELIAKQQDIYTEIEFNKQGFENAHYQVQITLLNKNNSNNFGQLVILYNITDKKELEKERLQLVKDLQNTLEKVKKLSGLLPICASCKKIRDDKGYWHDVESYVSHHTETSFSQGLCPDCKTDISTNNLT